MEKFIDYPKIEILEENHTILNQDVYIFEKLDGGLSQVRKMGGTIFGGSKSNFLIGPRTKYSWFPDFLRWMRSNPSLTNLPEEIIMFGEWLVPVTLEYNPEKRNRFYFIDLAFATEQGPRFYDYDEALSYLKNWKIKDVEILPPLAKGLFSYEQFKKIREGESQLGDITREGVVLKNYNTQQFAKSLNPQYSELREEGKGLERYVTDIRVRKAVRRLREDGIENPKLDDVVEFVASDIKMEVKGIPAVNREALKTIIRVRGLY